MPIEPFVYQLLITETNLQQKEIITAFLDQAGIDALEETDDGLVIYHTDESRLNEVVKSLVSINHMSHQNCSLSKLNNENWNDKWESSFQPVEVGDFCRIRASFHPPDQKFAYELVIDPKMAFGTGHHETTFLMIEVLKGLDLVNKSVLDFGCGTAILAILASKMKALKIVGIDNDPVAIECARNCLVLNNTDEIQLLTGDIQLASNQRFDVVLANINRNVLIDRSEELSMVIKKGGDLVVSGILALDEQLISRTFQSVGFKLLDTKRKGEWVCLYFINN